MANFLRVLIVDDDRDSADSSATLLEFWGHEAFVACDGLAALELARTHRPDVALLDLAVNGMDGFTIAERLRRQPESLNVVLIAVTGRGELAARQRSAASGFLHHLLKPVDPSVLQDLLTALWIERLKVNRSTKKGTDKMPLPKKEQLEPVAAAPGW